MLPLRDTNPRRSLPIVTILVILANAVVFLYEISLGPRAGEALVYNLGMIPARIPEIFATHGLSAASLTEAFSPLLTSVFLHSGWLHLIGNMWFLWVFGDNVEDALGHFKYLFFYLVAGIGAGVVHTLANLNSSVPAVGASGAISGVMGAYIVLYPRARILTWIPPIFILTLPAVIVLGYWFLIQFLSGFSELGIPSMGGVAWWAHIGGFVLGAAIVWSTRRR